MYGIVNQAIHGLVTENFGQDKWEEVKQRSGVEMDYFVSNQPYEDNITYELVAAASEVLDIPIEQFLFSFGEYWIMKTGMEKYGDLMKAGGKDFREFLNNLPNFHSRIMLIYPNMSPPEFAVEEISENVIRLHYYSERKGWTHFVLGLINGIGKLYSQNVFMDHIAHDEGQVWHDVFDIQLID